MEPKNRLRFLLLCTALTVSAARPWPAQAQNRVQLQQIYRIATDYERMGYYDRAASQFRLLFEMQPQNATYYSGLKRNLERLGRYDELIEVIQQRQEVVEDALSYSDLGSALYKRGEADAARRAWKMALKKFPRSTVAYAQVASAMLANQLYDEAIAVYQQARKKFNNPYLFSIELANVYSAKSNYGKATEEFLHYLEKNPRQLSYIQRRILSFFDETDSTRILKVVSRLAAPEKSPSPALIKLYAECLKRVGDFDRALALYLRVEESKKETDRSRGGEVYNFAAEAARAGRQQIAIRAYRLVVERWPKSPFVFSARIGLADAYLAQGQPEAAIQVVEGLLNRKVPHVFRLRALQKKAQILLDALGRPQEAAEVYETIFSTYPDRLARRTAALALGDCYIRLDDFDRARDWLARAQQLLSDNEVVLQNRILYKQAQLFFFEQRFTKAQELLSRIQPAPKIQSRTPVEDLVNDALDLTFFIDQALADSAGALRLYAEAAKLRAQRHLQEAAQKLENLVARFPRSVVAPRALMELAEIYAGLGRGEERIAAYQKILADYPASLYVDAALFHLARAYEELGRLADAVRHYEKLLVDYPESIYLEEARHRLRGLREKSGGVF